MHTEIILRRELQSDSDKTTFRCGIRPTHATASGTSSMRSATCADGATLT